jgi:hypothetical protein
MHDVRDRPEKSRGDGVLEHTLSSFAYEFGMRQRRFKCLRRFHDFKNIVLLWISVIVENRNLENILQIFG